VSERTRVMIIGLDGATFDLIKPWAEEGYLPTFKELLENGTHGPLKSTIPFATIPAWPSFATGCNPGKHGFFDFFKEKKNSYDLSVELYPSKAIKQPTLWEILSRYNKKVAVINVPGTYPPTEVNGYIITGMLTPPGAKFTYPAEFQEELISKIGHYNVFFSALSAKNPDVLLEDLEKTLKTRLKALEYLWKEKKPDFLMMVDNGTDRAEHELWRFLDPLNPLYNPKEIEKYGNPLLKYYQIVDDALQRIIEFLDDDTILFIMSDHGQGTLRKFVNLNLFLIKKGHMKIRNNIMTKLKYLLFNHGFTPFNIYKVLRKLGIERLASDRVDNQRKLSILNRFFFSTSDIDWSKTKAFASGVTGAISLNVKGRQPQGIIKYDKEYEDLREEIISDLFELEDSETGERIVKETYKREEIYDGPYLDMAPDIIAVPRDGYEFFGMYGFSSNKDVEVTHGNSGSHRPYGIFMAMGRGVKKGIKINGARIIDIAPTVLHVMGVPIPSHMDGAILMKIFEEDMEIAPRNVEYQIEDYEKERIRANIKQLKKHNKL